jgi:hypothetical protein
MYVAKPDSGIYQVASHAPEARKWLIDRLLALKLAFSSVIPAAASVAEASVASNEPTVNVLDNV